MAVSLPKEAPLEHQLQLELLVYEYESGTESLTEFCKRHGMAISTFEHWFEKFGSRSPSPFVPPHPADFVSLKVLEPEVSSPGFGPKVHSTELSKKDNWKNIRVTLNPNIYEALVTEQKRRREVDGRKTSLADLYAEYAETGMRKDMYEVPAKRTKESGGILEGSKLGQTERIVLIYPDGTELRIGAGADATFIKSLLPLFQRS